MLATRQPVLRRFWYPVMPAALVDQGPQPFTLLDERIVLWKDGSGRYAAMADRCPHRSAALSKGWVDGDALVCPYHGWAYDGRGTCGRSTSRWRRFPTGPRKPTPPIAASTSSTSPGTARASG
jgi:phenylpropionate dioxygenase-like ring-hydroxylating dioxygenase large terminal subunit